MSCMVRSICFWNDKGRVIGWSINNDFQKAEGTLSLILDRVLLFMNLIAPAVADAALYCKDSILW